MDNRKIKISPNEKFLYEGALIRFEARGFDGHRLKWVFGDGKVVVGGTRISHTYNRSGTFDLLVADPKDTVRQPWVQKVKILREDREIIPAVDVVYKGTELKIEARKFIDKYIKWNFGDGTGDRRGGARVTHTYTRAGTFKIKAVDFDGKGAKKIMRKIQVKDDRRSLEVTGTIVEGEPVSMIIKNGGGGDFAWEFSDGQKQTGLAAEIKSFRRAGTVSVLIKDRTGKYPPMVKKITVLPDRRRLEAKETFALPDEEVKLSVANFLGKTVKWDFGDGTVKKGQGISTAVKHKYKKTGKYLVTAVDFNGDSVKKFTREIRVGELSPEFRLTQLELAFDSGKYYKVTEKNNISPGYYVKFKARGRGILKGKWVLDGSTIGLFETILEENRTSQLEHRHVVQLPVIRQGMHTFTLVFTNYQSGLRIPFIRYFVTESGEIKVVEPLPGAKVEEGSEFLLTWRMKESKGLGTVTRKDDRGLEYEIAVSKVPFQFLEDDRVQWLKAGRKAEYKLKNVDFKGWVYWQVRQVDRSGRVLTTSDISSFRIKAR
ncbi:MAG: PKD domain-containing protein [bacterium]|nr:PKD domain-containing protein [bacterium]